MSLTFKQNKNFIIATRCLLIKFRPHKFNSIKFQYSMQAGGIYYQLFIMDGG